MTNHKPGECPTYEGNVEGDLCNGVDTLGPDPFAEEIHDDSTEYWMCEGERRASAMDI